MARWEPCSRSFQHWYRLSLRQRTHARKSRQLVKCSYFAVLLLERCCTIFTALEIYVCFEFIVHYATVSSALRDFWLTNFTIIIDQVKTYNNTFCLIAFCLVKGSQHPQYLSNYVYGTILYILLKLVYLI